MNPASDAFAAWLSVMSRMSRLRSNRRPSASRRASASCVRARATADRLLATRLTARKANSAIQFCGSAIEKVPMGGRKKKLKTSAAASDVVAATQRRAVAATSNTTIRKLRATVAAFRTCAHRVNSSARPVMPPMPKTSLRTSAETLIRSS